MLNIDFNPFPVLPTERLLLRRVGHNDANEIYFLRSDKEVMKYIGKPLASSLQEISDYINQFETDLENKDGIAWAITYKNDPRMVGIIAYRKLIKEHHRGEIGYGLHPDHQGKGVMQEALDRVVRYGFDVLGIHSVEANVDKENLASIRLLERNSFVREAHFRENYFFENQYIDSVIYSRVNDH